MYFKRFCVVVCLTVLAPVMALAAPQGIMFVETGDLKLSFGIEFEMEFLHPEGDDDGAFTVGAIRAVHTNQDFDRFSIDKLSIMPRIDYRDRLHFFGELEGHTTKRGEADTTIVREAHLTFDITEHFFIKAGLDERFISPEFMSNIDVFAGNKRLTEVYPINGIAFWKDEDLGLTLGGHHPFSDEIKMWWRLSMTNGLALDHEEITRNKIFPILADDRDIQNVNFDANDNMEIGAGLGLTHDLTKDMRLNLLAFYYTGRLSARDVDLLNAGIQGYASREHKNWMAGGNVDFTVGDFNVFAQFINARDGHVLRDGYYIQPSLLHRFADSSWFDGIRFVYRYNVLDVNARGADKNLFASPFTWDRYTHTAGVNVLINKNVTWRNEYHANVENTGGGPNKVHNDEFLSQLEIVF